MLQSTERSANREVSMLESSPPSVDNIQATVKRGTVEAQSAVEQDTDRARRAEEVDASTGAALLRPGDVIPQFVDQRPGASFPNIFTRWILH